MNDYLAHYGIKRRSGRYPWGSGERPYQGLSPMEKKSINKRIELATHFGKELTPEKAVKKNSEKDGMLVKAKGKSVQHITGVDFGKLRPGQLYVTATDYDNKLYETFLSMNLKKKGWNPSKVTLQLKDDLKVPSSRSQKQIFEEFAKKNKDQIMEDLKTWGKQKGKDLNDINKSRNDPEKLYDYFMNSLESSSESQKNFYKELKALGFNGVLDEHDTFGSWMQARKPIILMDALSVVGDVQIEKLSTDKILKAFDEWLKME